MAKVSTGACGDVQFKLVVGSIVGRFGAKGTFFQYDMGSRLTVISTVRSDTTVFAVIYDILRRNVQTLVVLGNKDGLVADLILTLMMNTNSRRHSMCWSTQRSTT